MFYGGMPQVTCVLRHKFALRNQVFDLLKLDETKHVNTGGLGIGPRRSTNFHGVVGPSMGA